jgi:hypothetical protein
MVDYYHLVTLTLVLEMNVNDHLLGNKKNY